MGKSGRIRETPEQQSERWAKLAPAVGRQPELESVTPVNGADEGRLIPVGTVSSHQDGMTAWELGERLVGLLGGNRLTRIIHDGPGRVRIEFK